MRFYLLIFSLLLSLTNSVQAQSQSSQSPVKSAPEWQLYDEQNRLTKSSDFAGKPLIIHFWATWCPYCKKLQPGLERLYTEYRQQGLEMIAISFWEDEGATPQAVLDARGYSFKTLVNGDKVARETFGVQGTPTTFFINRDNEIIAMTRISDPDDPRLEKIVKILLDNNSEEQTE